MALYTRYVLTVDSATGNDTQGSGSSATVKDSDSISGTTLVITNVAGGSTVTKADTTAFAGPPVAGADTIVFTDTVGGLGMFHIGTVSGDNKTLTLIEEPSTGTSIGNPWGVGGYFLTIARAALLAKPTNLNAGADDHVYVKAGSGYSGTVKVTFSNPGSRSRPLVFEGYTTTPGDGGMTTYDITATAVKAFEPNANECVFRNFKLTNSGAVASWFGVSPLAGRVSYQNIWATSSSSTAVGINMATNGSAFQCRANAMGSTYGINASVFNHVVCSIVHDTGRTGFSTYGEFIFCIADSCGTTTASNGGFQQATGERVLIAFCTSYNQGTTGDGLRISDSANNHGSMYMGNIFANNAGYGIDRVGITASLSLLFEAYNDFFSNGTNPRLNAEDTTAYDATPTDLTLDPQFTDAANQDFSIGANLRGAVAIDIGGL